MYEKQRAKGDGGESRETDRQTETIRDIGSQRDRDMKGNAQTH